MNINGIISIALLLHGLYSLYSSYKGKKTLFLESYSTTYISKKIFGKHFDRWHNFFWGIIEVILGVGLIKLFYFD
jgi:hypothetical protein